MRAPVPTAAPSIDRTAPPRLEITRVQSAEDEAAAFEIRRRVFADEQNVADLRVSDPDDARSLIALAKIWIDSGDGLTQRPVATGRLTPSPFPGGQAQIAWVATLPDMRSRGVGSALMRYLLDAADAAGAREVILAAQAHAEDFYRRLGFKPAGSLYDVRGIPHLRMIRSRPR
jgi:predicted GNAT family N-acyltransferase